MWVESRVMRLLSLVRTQACLCLCIAILSKFNLQNAQMQLGARARGRASYLNDNLRAPLEPASGWRSGAPASAPSGPNPSDSRAVFPCSPRESCLKLKRNKFSFAPEFSLPCSVVRRNSCRRRKLRPGSCSRTRRRYLDSIQRIRIVQQFSIAANKQINSSHICYYRHEQTWFLHR